MRSKLVSRLIVSGAVLALLAAGAVTLTLFKLPKPTAAAQQSIDPAIVTTHLRAVKGELALP